jgi:hypothetical protein
MHNGFVVTINSLDIEDNPCERTLVFEDKGGDSEVYGDRHSFIGVCWELIDYFGLTGSRYDSERINIKLEPGDKYEGNMEKH